MSVERIFGFSEFISGLALFVIVYTITDIRYKFRIKVSRVFPVSKYSIILIGFIALSCDVYFAQKWFRDYQILIYVKFFIKFLLIFVCLLSLYYVACLVLKNIILFFKESSNKIYVCLRQLGDNFIIPIHVIICLVFAICAIVITAIFSSLSQVVIQGLLAWICLNMIV